MRKFLEALVELDTQMKREEAVEKLEELAAIAHKLVVDEGLPLSWRLSWSQVETSVYATINGILRSYDAAGIKDEIAKIKKVIAELMEKRGRDQATL